MKFTDGAWLPGKGVMGHLARRVTEHRVEAGQVVLYVLDRTATEGADSFEGVVLQVRISSPLADVMRVQVQHWASPPGLQGFDLDYGLAAAGVKIVESEGRIELTSGRVTARVELKQFRLEFVDNVKGETITSTEHGALGYMEVAGERPRLMQRLKLGVGENLYGFGEQFTPFVKNGQSVKIWNEDGGTVSDQAYKTVPFYLSNKGYGVLVNSPGKVEFEVATERVQQVQFSVPAEALDYYVFQGPDPKAVLEKYTALSGRTPEVPAWTYGLWLSTSFTTKYDEKTVMEFVEGMAKREIPLSVFHFDCFWMKRRHWCNFLWDRDAFPDPEGMLRRLRARGLKVCVWINSYISGMSEIFEEGAAGGFFIRRKDGSVFQRDQWQPSMGIVDFTNPAAVAWYQGKLRKLLEMGVDCFKTDFGERIPVDDVQYHDGSDPALMHNYYPYLYNKAVFELLESFHGKGKAVVFARSATAGCQKFPLHWGGDCEATFESMAEDLRGGLSFCSSGAAFWSHDMGGFSGKADPAVYKRWAQLGLLSTHSRLHGSESYRVPWLFDEESVEVVRRFSKLKNRLVPYLLAGARDAAKHGWPLMRAMFVEFPGDPGCATLDRQYMLGGSLLVAPVFRPDGAVDYYLPAGEWTEVLTGKQVTGGGWRKGTYDFMHLPLLAREGTIVPMSDNEASPAWTGADGLTLAVFGAPVGTFIAVGSDGTHAVFTARREGSAVHLESNGQAKRVRVKVGERLIDWKDPTKPLSL
jgi:alpha-D-xyloside xylohydrolase